MLPSSFTDLWRGAPHFPVRSSVALQQARLRRAGWLITSAIATRGMWRYAHFSFTTVKSEDGIPRIRRSTRLSHVLMHRMLDDEEHSKSDSTWQVTLPVGSKTVSGVLTPEPTRTANRCQEYETALRFGALGGLATARA